MFYIFSGPYSIRYRIHMASREQQCRIVPNKNDSASLTIVHQEKETKAYSIVSSIPITIIIFWKSQKVPSKNIKILFWKLHILANIGFSVLIYTQKKGNKTYNWVMKSVLEFTFEKLEKLSFQKIILKFFDGTFQYFFFRKFRNMVVGIGLVNVASSLGTQQ